MKSDRFVLLLALAALIVLSSFSGPLTASATTLNQQDADLFVYEVTLENLTIGQPFSPPIAVTHSDLVRMFDVGAPASDAMAAIAQDGDSAPMIEVLGEVENGVTDVVNVGRPLAPDGTVVELDGSEITDSVTFSITAAPGDFFSLSSMLICTNDGFVGLDSAVLPEVGEEQLFALGAYDAGREENTEASTDLVDPCSALGLVTLAGDPNGNINDDVATVPIDSIAETTGISEIADLSVEAHGWIEVATVTITNLGPASTIGNVTGDVTDAMESDTETIADDSGLISVQSRNDFDRTVQQLEDTLEQQGLIILAVIDHAANAESVDLTLPPTTLILTGNPNLGTPLMQSSRSIAIDLPQKFLVWEDGNADVFVTYNDPEYLANRHGVDDQEAIVGRIGTALGNFADAATSIIPSVTVANQQIVADSVVVVEAVSDGPGWIVIHADEDGAPGPVIGNSALLTDGVNSGIAVEINTEVATSTLYAMLHTDAGEVGVYEFPGPDAPVLVDGEVVAPAFSTAVAEEKTTPSVSVSDQDIVNDSVVVAEAVSDGPGWIVIHADEDGAPGPVIGNSRLLTDGINSDIVVDINADAATDRLYAMLHTDAGIAGTYEFPGTDVPVQVDGEVVTLAFNTATGEAVQFIPSVTISDQEIINESVIVAEAVSDGPGWVVIHADQDGAPGPVIGNSPRLANGVNSDFPIAINVEVMTDRLYAMLHIDAGIAGTYEFPGPDVPVQFDGEVIAPAFDVTIDE